MGAAEEEEEEDEKMEVEVRVCAPEVRGWRAHLASNQSVATSTCVHGTLEVAAQSTRVHPSSTSFVTPHSGNFISHNRALKPPLRTSFTPPPSPPLHSLYRHPSRLVSPRSAVFLSPFLSMGLRLFVLQIPAALLQLCYRSRIPLAHLRAVILLLYVDSLPLSLFLSFISEWL